MLPGYGIVEPEHLVAKLSANNHFFTSLLWGTISLYCFPFRLYIEIWLLVIFSLVKTKFVKFPTLDLPVM